MIPSWREIGDRVYVRRHSCYDVNVGLVVGTGRCLVIDTLSTHEQARELIEAIRTVTAEPWTVLNTHFHFDHCFGNAIFRPAPIVGHFRTVQGLNESGATQRQTVREMAVQQGNHDFAEQLAAVDIDPPDQALEHTTELDIGGRRITAHYLGRGHTDGDLVVEVADSAVLFTGDLIEEGAPPSFEDSFPLDWPGTASALLPLAHGAVVPGHGDVVDREFIERQAGDLARVAEHARILHAAGRGVSESFGGLPFPETAARIALDRALWQLDPRP
ncbi:MAG TPA: MBL fold metallo-hydrolase [Mycobacteriales bacterium]|nr:MBL fold metallo-hydrolase [Mycobacteriales bacterium]